MTTVQENLLIFAEKIKNEINCQLPAKVVAVNDDGTVNVTAIRNDDIEDCVITIPVIQPETARAYIALKIKKGDRGVIKFCDRSIEEYRTGNENSNGDERCHSISDGIFQLGFLPSNEKFVFPDGEITIGLKNKKFTLTVNETGDFTISANNIIITAAKTSITSPIEIKGDIDVSGNIKISGNTQTTGNISVTGKISATDVISSDTDVLAAGKSGLSHTHTSTAPGSPTSVPN